ncbi:MAG: low molecular weight protein-tyrosine-phosphatase [Candidatus Coproplasma sp.]
MFNVVFVCLGNICRSPMAEAVFKRLVEEEGLSYSFNISSFATSDCEQGNPVYYPAARLLKAKGYNFTHRAKQISLKDIKNADYILCMDMSNYSALISMAGSGYADKVYLLGHFLPEKIVIDDPWYTNDFDRAYAEIYASCKAFLAYLKQTHGRALNYDKFE